MEQIKNNELKSIKAGAIKWGLLGIIGGIVAFVIGVIEGYVNPTKCR